MDVKIVIPQDVKDVQWDPETRTLTIVPRFYTTQKVPTIGLCAVTGKAGRKRKHVLRVSGHSGNLQLQAEGKQKLKETDVPFDKPPEKKS